QSNQLGTHRFSTGAICHVLTHPIALTRRLGLLDDLLETVRNLGFEHLILLAAEEADGWTLAKRNKRSLRLERAKPIDRQLEDDVWSLLYRMGFKALNPDRNFYIVGKDGSRRQLDVFAKDDETVFVVECTHAQDTATKSVKQLLDKIGAIRETSSPRCIRRLAGIPLKVKIAIATRNVDIRTVDRQRAAAAGVPVITEADVAYFLSSPAF
ncbi:hypothetical protein ACWGTI_32395, partial [Mesorhizobium sp. ArgA1]